MGLDRFPSGQNLVVHISHVKSGRDYSARGFALQSLSVTERHACYGSADDEFGK